MLDERRAIEQGKHEAEEDAQLDTYEIAGWTNAVEEISRKLSKRPHLI